MQHHRAVLAGGIEHHRPLAPRDYLAQDVDALGLEPLEMAQRGDPPQVASPRLPARSRPGGGAGLISGHGRQSGGSPAWLGSSLRDGVYGTEDGRAWPPTPPGGGGRRLDTPLMVDTGHESAPDDGTGERQNATKHLETPVTPCSTFRRAQLPPSAAGRLSTRNSH